MQFDLESYAPIEPITPYHEIIDYLPCTALQSLQGLFIIGLEPCVHRIVAALETNVFTEFGIDDRDIELQEWQNILQAIDEGGRVKSIHIGGSFSIESYGGSATTIPSVPQCKCSPT
jgi:hypothetical protein